MFLLCLLLCIPSASALTLSFQDCVERVSGNNPELESARQKLRSAEEASKGALSPFFPELSANLSGVRQSPASAFGNPLYSAGFGLKMNLFSGFRDSAQFRQARARLGVARATLDLTRAKISYQLRRSFAQAQYARDNVELTEKIRERRAQNERLVRALYENGRENKGSYLLSRALLEQAIFDARVARDQAVIANQQLAHVLGEDRLDLSIQGEIRSLPPPGEAEVTSLLPLTPTHRIRNSEFELAEATAQGAWSGFLPSLDLSGSTGLRSADFLPDRNRQWSLGLTLSIPLLSGLSTVRDVTSKSALKNASFSDLTTADFDLLSELRQSLFTYQQAVDKLRVDLGTLEAATVRATISRKRYNNGILMFEQWDIIETDLINRQKTALASKRDRIIAESAWMQSQGVGDLP
jgi:outer membrane protein